MTVEQPPRLKHSDEFGPLLRAAEAQVSPERLAANAAGVRALIAAKTTIATWKLLLPLLLLLGISVPLVVVFTGKDGAGGATEVAAVPAPDAGVDAAAVILLDAAEVAIVTDAPVEPVPEPKRPARSALAIDAGIDAAPPSDLPEQIRIYEAARAAGQRGELAHGLDLLAELLRRFPATPLRAEAELTRAELLARADRVDDAAPALEALIADPAHRGRKGELLRTLGDLHRRSGDCPRAAEAYTRALGERLSARARSDIERGRDGCTVK